VVAWIAQIRDSAEILELSPRLSRPRSVKSPVPRFTSIYRHGSFTKEDNDHLSINVTPAIPSGTLLPLYSLPVRYNPNGLLFSYG